MKQWLPLREVLRRHAHSAMRHTEGNVTHAADVLQCSNNHLRMLIGRRRGPYHPLGKFPGISGIYCIRNVVTDEKYVGCAASLRARRTGHFQNLVRGKHHNGPLQRSYDLHGEGAFVFEVIELCDEAELFDRERFWIHKIRPSMNVAVMKHIPT